MIITVSLLLIAPGLAADNLMVAGMSGSGFAVTQFLEVELKKKKSQRITYDWYLILLFVFFVQNQVLQLGDWLAVLTTRLFCNTKEWIKSGLIFAMAIKMLQEPKTKNKSFLHFSFESENIISWVMGTSVYVFIFAFAMHWLYVSEREVNLLVIPSILIFIAIGMLLGKFHCTKILQFIHTISVMLILCVSVLLLIEKLKYIF